MRESRRISEAREAYEHTKSEEGLPGPPGIKFDSPSQANEHRGSRIEKKEAITKTEKKTFEEVLKQGSIAEEVALNEGLLDPETGAIDADLAHAFILDLPAEDQAKALEALREYEESVLQKEGIPELKDKKVEIAPGITLERATVTQIIPKRKSGKPLNKSKRISGYERNMMKFVAIDANSVKNWMKQKRDGSKRWLFMNASSWDQIDNIQKFLSERRDEINALPDNEERNQERRLWVTISDKLKHNRIALRKKSVKQPRVKKSRTEKKPTLKKEDEKGRNVISNMNELDRWIDAQEPRLAKGDNPEKLVISATSEDGLREVSSIIKDLSGKVEAMSESPLKKQRTRIVNRIKSAYRSACWFVRNEAQKAAATLKDKKKKYVRGQQPTTKRKPKPSPKEQKEAV